MKKTRLLHPQLSEVIASLGHNDMVVIADAGLPIPPETWRIDLALTKGIPGFVDTLDVILSEMQVDRILLAKETVEKSPHIQHEIMERLPQTAIEYITHEELKQICHTARAIVRTGEFTPYANAILVAGVVF